MAPLFVAKARLIYLIDGVEQNIPLAPCNGRPTPVTTFISPPHFSHTLCYETLVDDAVLSRNKIPRLGKQKCRTFTVTDTVFVVLLTKVKIALSYTTITKFTWVHILSSSISANSFCLKRTTSSSMMH